MFRILRLALLAALVALAWVIASPTQASGPTVGLIQNDLGSYDGYTLFAPMTYDVTYLIDNDGNLIHSWITPGHATSAYLLEDGSLIRAAVLGGNPTFSGGGRTGVIRRYDWDGNLTWEYVYSTPEHITHHDFEVLPDGNILMIAWELKTSAEAIAAGRDLALLEDGELFPDHVIEVHPTGPTTGDIVWEWHVWDHLIQDFDNTKANYGVVADHPELVDVNYFSSTRPAGGEDDWLHTNAIDYHEEFDQIVLSARNNGELWVIDHSTTTAEAAGHTGGDRGKGGDLLYRWGNPEAYDAGTAADHQLFQQHDVNWIDPGLPGSGHFLVFNNGVGRPGGNASSADEIIPPVDSNGDYALTSGSAYGPAAPTWTYTASIFSSSRSSAGRLPNGNTLICSCTHGTIFEVTAGGAQVWEYHNPLNGDGPLEQGEPVPGSSSTLTNNLFRAYRYAPDYPGLLGRDLTPLGPIEITDADGDGLLNLDELKVYGTDPHLADTDGDGLSDGEEIVTYATDPLLADTDTGGSPDGIDAALGDPLDPADDAAQLAADTDGDGCTNGQEIGPDEMSGGLRDPFNEWDFFDTNGDKTVNLVDDIFAVADAFGLTPADAGYSVALDRSPAPPGAEVWEMGPPDGIVDLFNDVFGAAFQFGHSCA